MGLYNPTIIERLSFFGLGYSAPKSTLQGFVTSGCEDQSLRGCGGGGFRAGGFQSLGIWGLGWGCRGAVAFCFVFGVALKESLVVSCKRGLVFRSSVGCKG